MAVQSTKIDEAEISSASLCKYSSDSLNVIVQPFQNFSPPHSLYRACLEGTALEAFWEQFEIY